MEAELNAMAPSHYRRQHRSTRQSNRGGRSLALAALATLAFGLPQLVHALMPYMQTGTTPRQAFWTRSLRYNPQRSCRATNNMNSVSPKLQQQEGGDEGMLLSPGAIDESGGGGGVGEAVTVAATDLPSSRVRDDSIQEQAERSKWSWGRKKKEGEEKKGKGLFSYDWENGDRIVWKASKKCKAEVVSTAAVRSFSVCIYDFRPSTLTKIVTPGLRPNVDNSNSLSAKKTDVVLTPAWAQY